MERRTLIKAAAMAAAAGSGAAGSEQPASTRSTDIRERRHPGMFIEADDGTRLFCRDWGGGAPVVFCHPWALNADIWEYQAIELSEQGLRCIAARIASLELC
jgi:non-heme chloroperoxidase